MKKFIIGSSSLSWGTAATTAHLCAAQGAVEGAADAAGRRGRLRLGLAPVVPHFYTAQIFHQYERRGKRILEGLL